MSIIPTEYVVRGRFAGKEPPMRMETFIRHVRLPVSAEETFAWHARPGALERMFRYRHDTAAADLAIHAKHADRR